MKDPLQAEQLLIREEEASGVRSGDDYFITRTDDLSGLAVEQCEEGLWDVPMVISASSFCVIEQNGRIDQEVRREILRRSKLETWASGNCGLSQ